VTYYNRTFGDYTGGTCQAAPNKVAEHMGLDLKLFANGKGLF
jgi:hypothetical protein